MPSAERGACGARCKSTALESVAHRVCSCYRRSSFTISPPLDQPQGLPPRLFILRLAPPQRQPERSEADGEKEHRERPAIERGVELAMRRAARQLRTDHVDRGPFDPRPEPERVLDLRTESALAWDRHLHLCVNRLGTADPALGLDYLRRSRDAAERRIGRT